MYSYAQTNIQLFNQIRRNDYLETDLCLVRDSYCCAVRLFSGQYRASGKPFICHLIGTASILADLQVPAEVVIAGLLHSAYSHGEFGTGVFGAAEYKRRYLQNIIGTEAEQIIYRYAGFKWNEKIISALNQNPEKLSTRENEVLLIRLANELEDHLDLMPLYHGNSEKHKRSIETYLFNCVELAEKLDQPLLAARLAQAFDEVLSSDIPDSLLFNAEVLARLGIFPSPGRNDFFSAGSDSSFFLVPNSYRLRITAKLRRLKTRYGKFKLKRRF